VKREQEPDFLKEKIQRQHFAKLGCDADGRPVRKQLSRKQWHEKNRFVVVSDADAARVIDTLSGYRLHLFDESQTEECGEIFRGRR
jgi:hypothetical protein